jgi:uncharacterized membrane protein YedE/YeeE
MSPTADIRPARRYLDWRVGGVLLGLLLTGAVAAYKPLGVSTSYCTSWGMLFTQVAPEWAAQHPYLKAVGTSVTGEWMLVLGLIVGALAAALASRRRVGPAAPAAPGDLAAPAARDATSPRRFVAAFVGGILFLFGARLAGGCTSGHIMSGVSQLALSGFVFAAAVFASGIATARLSYRKGARP